MATARTRLATSVLLLAAVAPARPQAPAAPAAPPVDVRVDPRIELLSVVFRLAGNPEYSMGRVQRYTDAVQGHFGAFREHDVVLRARRLRTARGVGFDAVASFAVHLAGIDPPRGALPWDPLPLRLDSRWSSAEAEAFAADLGRFARDAGAAAFFAGQRDLYARAEQQLRQVLAANADFGWFERFFGRRPGARFQLLIGLLNGGANYGPSVRRADGAEDLYCVLGCWQTDGDGMPAFAPEVVGTVVHEFCHSYCNPVVDAHLAELLPAGERLYALVAGPMQAQAYASARTMLCESLVRASVVRYLAATKGEAAAAAEIRAQEQRSFHWTRGLAELLAGHEQHRERCPTLDGEVGELARFFAAEVPKVAALLARKPKVAQLVPANGATDVDPGLKQLVVTFDRPMRDQSWSVVGGGEHFPKLGKPSYDAARKVLTIPVTLQPAWHYELWLNQGRFDAFRSEDGEPLAPVHVTFATRAR